MESLWRDTAQLPHFEALEGDLKTDVLVVGGGMAGLLCAYLLQEAGVDCALVEAVSLCSGVTGNTTAKLTAQHGLIYDRLSRLKGWETARLYLEANLAALDKFRSLCREIDCDFQEQDSYVYSLDEPRRLEQEAEALEHLGAPAELVSQTPLPFAVAGALRFPGQAQFHPLRFAAALAKGLRIYEDTKVLELTPGLAVTNRGKIRAERIVIATHFPFLNKHGAYFIKLYQERAYVVALRGAPPLAGMYVDEAEEGHSFRSAGELLLLGGGGVRTGRKSGGWRELTAFSAWAFPEAAIAYRWAAQDCMSLDGLPYVGPYSPRTRGLYVLTGFNKWGMTNAMAGAQLLTELLQGRSSPYAGLFDPARTLYRPQLATNTWETLKSLAKPTRPRCPHMGCALQYNAQEHSWDCPCHGSRFSQDGKLLDNPATDDKKL